MLEPTFTDCARCARVKEQADNSQNRETIAQQEFTRVVDLSGGKDTQQYTRSSNLTRPDSRHSAVMIMDILYDYHDKATFLRRHNRMTQLCEVRKEPKMCSVGVICSRNPGINNSLLRYGLQQQMLRPGKLKPPHCEHQRPSTTAAVSFSLLETWRSTTFAPVHSQDYIQLTVREQVNYTKDDVRV